MNADPTQHRRLRVGGAAWGRHIVVRSAVWPTGWLYLDVERDFLYADWLSRSCRFAKVLAGHQLEDQLIERDFGLVIGAREAN